MKPRRLLLVTYYYPPQPGSGSNRWGAMVKYLRRLGHHVTVVTAAPPGQQRGDSEGVVRTGSLNSNPALRRLLLRQPQATGSAAPDGAGPTAATGADVAAGRVMPPLLWKGIVPDPWLATWAPYALAAIYRELRRAQVDCIITSSPAESTHLLALALRSRRPAWLADFRDGWTFEPLRPRFPAAAQRAIDRRLEAEVARGADVVVGVTTPIAEDFRTRLGVAAELITNGFDPELSDEAGSALPSEEGAYSFVHTGALSGPRGRDPRPLLEALRRLLDQRPELDGRVRLLVAGRSEENERALIEQARVGHIVRHLGYLPRSQALALQREAKALVLITSRDRCEATGKLYEYIAARRPIVALASGNEAARIVAETNTGVLVDPDDVEAITRALVAAVDGELERIYEPRGIEGYAYPLLAEQMASAIESAIEHRALAAKEPC